MNQTSLSMFQAEKFTTHYQRERIMLRYIRILQNLVGIII